MIFRWLKFFVLIVAMPLLMSTSCVKFGPYYSTVHEIECPPEEYHFPMYAEKEGLVLEMIDKIKGWCAGLPSFTVAGLNKGFFKDHGVMVYAKIHRNQQQCNISVAIPTYVHGIGEKVNWKKLEKTDVFQAGKRATEIFPSLLGLKTTGKKKVVTGEAKMESIQSWCKED